MPSFQDDDQHDQNKDQNDNGSHLLVIPRLPRKRAQVPPRLIKRGLMPIDMSIDLVQHLDMLVQLIANLDTQLPLPPDALAQPIQSLVLLRNHLLVVLVDLHIVQV